METKRLRALVAQQQQELELMRCELHDGLMQYLVAAHMLCESARRELDRNGQVVPQELTELRDHLQHALHEGRRLLDGLPPPPLSSRELPEAIRKLTETLSQQATVNCDIQAKLSADFPAEQAQTLWRIAHEAVQNIRKHSHAGHVQITIWQTADELCLDIADDGHGFDPANVAAGRFGLTSMQRRAAFAGGTCQIESSPGRGTKIQVRLPREA